MTGAVSVPLTNRFVSETLTAAVVFSLLEKDDLW